MDRGQCTGVEDATATSLPFPVPLGIPQGLVLEPILFIIYIDGFTNVLSNDRICLYHR